MHPCVMLVGWTRLRGSVHYITPHLKNLVLKVVLFLPSVDGNSTCFFIIGNVPNSQYLSDILITMIMHFCMTSAPMYITVRSLKTSPPLMSSRRNSFLMIAWDLE